MIVSFARDLGRALGVALALSLAPAAASAQNCLTPDGLTGPCWEFVEPNLPQFPGFTLPGLGCCWTNCAPEEECIQVSWSPPLPTGICAQYRSQVDVSDCNGNPLMRGTAILDYTRNWEELGPPGTPNHEVWRFMAKIDFEPNADLANLCPVPTCLGPTPTAFFYGYVDWARNCETNEFRNATVLFHNCDWFIHQQGLSNRPGTFHPETTYAVIAPNFPDNPFVCASMPRFGGDLVAEAVRNVTNPLGLPFCQAEERIEFGVLDPYFLLCFCFDLNFNSFHNTLSTLLGAGACPDPITGLPSLFQSLTNFFPVFPWFDLVTTSIGTWTTASSYPGPEQVWVEEGFFRYHDSCPIALGAGQSDSFEVFYGASTDNGYPVVTPGLTQRFLDLADNYSLVFGLPAPPFLFGSILPTDHLIYVNVP